MASEIRVNQIQSRTGVSTVSFTDTGPIVSGVTTVQGSLDVTGGSVGIGTATATYKLDVESNGNYVASFVQTDTSSAKGGIIIDSKQGRGDLGTWNAITINANDNVSNDSRINWFFDSIADGPAIGGRRTSASGTDLIFYTTTSESLTEKLRINSSGNIGIGTDNPTSAKLHIRNDSGELARFQINDQTASGRIVCVGGTASYSGINFGDVDNVDAGKIRHYNDDNSNASGSFLLYTNDTVRIALNRYGLLTNYPGSNSAGTGGTILGRYKYTQQNESQNYEHLILGPDGRKLQDLVDTNCFCVITICVTGTGTNNMFCQYHYHANQSVGSSTLTHIAGNDISSSNRPYMVLVNTHDPAWKMNHNTGYTVDIEVAIYGGNDQYTYTTQFGEFGANP